MRIAGGLLIAAAFLAALFYVTLEESSVRCTACVTFGDSSKCSTVAAPDRDQAVMQAVATSCSMLASGVTQGMRCTRTPPTTVNCND